MRIFFTILFTTIFCFLVLLPVFYSIKNRWSENKKNEEIKTESPIEKRPLFLLDERSLQSQPMFWTVIALPLVVGAILWAVVAYQYKWEISTSAYSSFMKNAQFPFVIIALSPILGAFVMYGHRSIQTFTQINATNEQIKTALEQLKEAKNKNKNDMYFNVRKHIYEQLSYIKTINDEKINKPTSLYIKAFETKNYEDTINEDFSNKVNSILIDFREVMVLFRELFKTEYVIINQESLFARYRQEKMLKKFIIIIDYINEFKSCLFFSKGDAMNIQSEKFQSELIELNKEINKIHEDDFDKDIMFYEISNKYFDYLDFFLNTIEDLLDVSSEIMVVLYPDRSLDELLPNHAFIRGDVNQLKIDLIDLHSGSIGGILAAANQNPPE